MPRMFVEALKALCGFRDLCLKCKIHNNSLVSLKLELFGCFVYYYGVTRSKKDRIGEGYQKVKERVHELKVLVEKGKFALDN